MIPGYGHALLVHWQSRRFGELCVFTGNCVDLALFGAHESIVSRGLRDNLPIFCMPCSRLQLSLHLCRFISGIGFALEFNLFRIVRFERGKLLF